REVENTVLLTLDNPPMNTLGIEEVERIKQFFQNHEGQKSLVITGTGRAFSAGVDTKAFASYTNLERTQLFNEITAMTAALMAITAPVVAAVNGHAMGGGLVLALCADYRIAAHAEAKFGLTEANAGIAFPAGPAAVISHELSPNLLRRMTLSSCIVDADLLLREGVFDEIGAVDLLVNTALQKAESLARQPAFAKVKQQVRGELAGRLAAMVSSNDRT
ncbi:MAG: enoyl-CoA hydratase/isomerase family protein, partial [Pseudomonadota bacterium]